MGAIGVNKKCFKEQQAKKDACNKDRFPSFPIRKSLKQLVGHKKTLQTPPCQLDVLQQEGQEGESNLKSSAWLSRRISGRVYWSPSFPPGRQRRV
eukprot:1158052-Pelagomonas_calceolata.AAC.4